MGLLSIYQAAVAVIMLFIIMEALILCYIRAVLLFPFPSAF